jgi:hypothetical protein
VRAFLAERPTWVVWILTGAAFGVAMSVCLPFVLHGDWVFRVITGVVLGALGGVLFGFLMSRIFTRDIAAARAVLDELPVEQRTAAIRAAARGPAPADPVIRRAALRQAENSRDSINRWWRFNTAVYGGGTVLYAALALTVSWWWWFLFALFASLLVVTLTSRRRVDRRIAVLCRGALDTE